MPRPISFKDFRRWFEAQGVIFEERKRGGSHNFMMARKVDGIWYKYPIPLISGRQILDIYIKPARRKLKLTAEDGCADSNFC